ncbi:hypothetical protein Ddye_027218 [Dipteronia dyeriana]|uniref:Uncharacterized protein n=1 Tax=Dipteronia dyeriana TaxID=168575 RepID=A0AAD9WR64_9ROSI|nr:hypothetical protein Ddye_027218 [Dipteronia dyeriana]
MDKTIRVYTELEYNRHMEELRNLHLNVYDYVIDVGPYKWSRVHCPNRRDRNMDFTSLCADFYKRQTLIDSYSVPIMPVGHPSTWVVPSDIAERAVLNPISRRQAGRLRSGRHILSSERTTIQNCRRYGQPGHNSRRCSSPYLINEGLNRVVPEEYRCKCSICPIVGHNRQTFPTRDSTVE